MEKIISEADHKTGEAKCKYYAGRISFLYEEEVRITLFNSLTAFCKNIVYYSELGHCIVKFMSYYDNPKLKIFVEMWSSGKFNHACL